MLGLLFNFELGQFVLEPDLGLTSVTLFKTTLTALQMTHLHSIDLNGNKKPPGERIYICYNNTTLTLPGLTIIKSVWQNLCLKIFHLLLKEIFISTTTFKFFRAKIQVSGTLQIKHFASLHMYFFTCMFLPMALLSIWVSNTHRPVKLH